VTGDDLVLEDVIGQPQIDSPAELVHSLTLLVRLPCRTRVTRRVCDDDVKLKTQRLLIQH
jgi:hypothetical protein